MAKQDGLAERVRAGERRALGRAITLIESTKPADREAAEALLQELLPATGGAYRIGITGAPGAGKSTFIEAFGLYLIAQGHRVAVLAIDPSSAKSGGSILGDKTRMERLAREEASFIRPSPTRGALGGVARRTREAMLACEAAGFDVVIVETVGVGQSEVMVAEMVDCFVLLIQPGGGDELQGMKRGIIELADLILVNKADGELKPAAERTAAEYRAALHLFPKKPGDWTVRVEPCSALKDEGIDAAWGLIERHRRRLEESGALAAKRDAQARAWMWHELRESLMAEFTDDPEAGAMIGALEARVGAGELSPGAAARRLLAAFLEKDGG
ncbi:MAG: methylmalonyl Co-A mutase-associated GTPase MeaB [Alphaproteobacteria bacterium]